METAALVPQTANTPATVHKSIFLDMERFANAQRVGTLLASSSLVPEAFRGNVANCVIALNLADRLMVDPFMMMQNMYVVHGRPGIEGKLIIALIEGSGRFSTLKFKFEGKGITEKKVPRPDSCIAYATELSTGEVIEGPPVTWEMAVAEGWTSSKGGQTSKWQTIPDLMFRYRAATFFGRVNCSGALLGLRTVEEIEDIEMVRADNGTFEAGKDAPFDTVNPGAQDQLEQFEISIPEGTDRNALAAFIGVLATQNKTTGDAVKLEAMKQPAAFWSAFETWQAKQKKDAQPLAELAPAACPDEPEVTRTKVFCEQCKKFDGCPAWEE
jgi:hypothetical protein